MTESAIRSPDSDPRSLAPVREGETLGGKYLVGKLIDVGGMGAVFEAVDTRLERRVAIKVLLPRLVASPTAAERFKREARAATRISSEHVVKVLEIGDLSDGTPFLVMEFLEGRDLRAVLRESGPLPPEQAVDYVLQAIQAVAEGHLAAIVHRDLKPSNLFLTERADGTPLIKVLDFGIAKTLHLNSLEDFALTSSDDIQLGSPTYMPPEQFQSPRDVDARADVWALGVTLYELITGRVPFSGHTYAELISQVLSAKPDSMQAMPSAPVLPEGLEEIIARCLEKNRDLRFENTVALAVALAPFGSADARLSLTRVSGLARPRSPNPVGPSRDSGVGYEATLPVAVDRARFDRTPTSTSSGARRVPRAAPPKRGRKLLALFSLSGMALAILWLAARPIQPQANVRLPRPLASSLSAPLASPAGLATSVPANEAPSAPSVTPVDGTVAALSAHTTEATSAPKRARRAPASLAVGKSVRELGKPEADASMAESPTQPSLTVPSARPIGLGLSPKIEDLIDH